MPEIVSFPASFINLDLELESFSDLGPLAEELARSVFVLYCGPVEAGFRLSVEPVISGALSTGPDACTEHCLSMLEALSPEGAALLQSCTSRVFDYGFEGGLEANPIHTDLNRAHLARMVAAGVDLRITTYPYRAAEPGRWRPATEAEVRELLVSEMATLEEEHRRKFEEIRTPLERVPVLDSPGEFVFIVAKAGRAVLYWSDIEEGWELQELSADGAIDTRGSNQFELSHIAYQLFGEPDAGI